jgi:phage terminase large subunit-like protein
VSTADDVLALDDDMRAELISSLSPEAAAALLYDWPFWARPDQLAPPGTWSTWLILAGRGWGKTRTGAEWLKTRMLERPGSRWAIVAPTYADARDTCVEGESGLLSILPPGTLAKWNRSLGELAFSNGAQAKLFSADEPERLRGPQHHGSWCDELAAWRYPDAWDQLLFGLRLGERPQTVVTTTPKPTALVRALAKDPTTVVTRGNTFDNARNLSPAALAKLRERYEGTRLGRQELYAEILEDVEGALWSSGQIEALRVREHPPLQRIVVAIDPAVTHKPDSDETGIIVAGVARVGRDLHGYVLDDLSDRMSANAWARKAVGAYRTQKADRIVAEVNNGGDLVEVNVRLVDSMVAYSAVHAARGKRTRAEPVAALYEQGRVHHVGGFPKLEDQMTTWDPSMSESPDRLDALVWALSELMLGDDPISRMRAMVKR